MCMEAGGLSLTTHTHSHSHPHTKTREAVVKQSENAANISKVSTLGGRVYDEFADMIALQLFPSVCTTQG